ncbi:cobalamin biosynthesis protein CobG [Tateyamaria omphalii]|uniref:Cobalamin biosynthesis protein CobG n=1 Tax=Tateyamaria omphalii TaxID=299262 RepID=A0A1P8MVU2_9RHOB|nr:cobalamin biosynthesis protein CobG [Tateyamaria omphalii]APX12138.1 cobalamin biosynthesis protein CobG [Tateyamaria omphalii]
MSIKGWCPGAWRPMMSGDGLIVRIRPRLARLTQVQTLGLCALSQTHGNGIIDLTSRANLQMRGINGNQYDSLLQALQDLDLLDATPEAEAKRNIVTTPKWQDGDLTMRLHAKIISALPDMPTLPAKMGIAIDTGPAPLLSDTSADFRFERSPDGIILRADGAEHGQPVTEHTAAAALIDLANWFLGTNGAAAGRMAKHLKTTALPAVWQTTGPAPAAPRLQPGNHTYGAPFGSIDASDLAALIQDSQAMALRVTPWRLFTLENAKAHAPHGFITDANDPLLHTHACPGAPACASATVDTRSLARQLAKPGLHISGCAKGCAHPRRATTTLVGNNGTFDLVENGHPWDAPRQRGLTAQDLLTPAS